MNRTFFLQRLRAGLAGLPPAAIDDWMADYEAHFDEGAAAGRSEADLAVALGDPDRLAREIRAEIGLRRWEAERTPASAAAAVFAVLGLGVVDVFVLMPILLTVFGVLSSLGAAALGVFSAGAVLFVLGVLAGAARDVAATMLTGFGVMAGAVSVAALATLVTVGLVQALVAYARLHLTLLKPALKATEAHP